MQRNGQNPIKAVRNYENSATKLNDEVNVNANTVHIAGICSACQTEVPLKAGFRVSSLKCPKCGKPLGRK